MEQTEPMTTDVIPLKKNGAKIFQALEILSFGNGLFQFFVL